MPLYEFLCKTCGATEEVFTRTVQAEVHIPTCPNAGKSKGKEHEMHRIVSKFAQHRTVADQLVEAEARWGKEVEAAMGPEPDIGKYARRYDKLAKGLPSANDV